MSDSRTPEQEAPTPANWPTNCPTCADYGDALYALGAGYPQLIEDRRFCHQCSASYPARSSSGETDHA